MRKQEVIDILNSLDDREIVCWLYQVLELPASEVARLRKLTINQVYHAQKQIIRSKRHDDIIAALSELFCNCE